MRFLDQPRRSIRSRRTGPKIDLSVPLPALDSTMIAAADAAMMTSSRRGRLYLAAGVIGMLLAVGAIALLVATGSFREFTNENTSPAAWQVIAAFAWLIVALTSPFVAFEGMIVTRRHSRLAAARPSAAWTVHRYSWYVSGYRPPEFWLLLIDDGEDWWEYRLHQTSRNWGRLRRSAPGFALLLNLETSPKAVVIWIPGSPRVWTAW